MLRWLCPAKRRLFSDFWKQEATEACLERSRRDTEFTEIEKWNTCSAFSVLSVAKIFADGRLKG